MGAREGGREVARGRGCAAAAWGGGPARRRVREGGGRRGGTAAREVACTPPPGGGKEVAGAWVREEERWWRGRGWEREEEEEEEESKEKKRKKSGRKMDTWMNLLNGNERGSSNNLEWDDNQFASPPEKQGFGQPAIVNADATPTPTPVMKGNKKRTRNFSVQEDNLLVAAWLEINMDAVQGIDQPRGTYWERIHDYYHMHKEFESDRNPNSLAHRWGIILAEVNRFCGWYAQVANRPPSAATEQGVV
ncbi:hypothetical protein BAE44_0011000 [Dichanthelium oligosanthes]|uniref:No apical meristem-associated C-terminal domain-containing protein n=1 Tax=Dichanthelium oligosanthes TaxID=888268 RepID=A0A1E5VS97_9POAL|nr:hypothetical protein BAE44_0011000 [Dichanthelium oligosanthes]